MSIAVCPGSFDPITNGHLDIIRRAAGLFDQVVVLAAVNPNKHYAFSIEERCEMIRLCVSDLENVEVDIARGLLVDDVRRLGVCAIVKGLRAVSDFEYEFQQALVNKKTVSGSGYRIFDDLAGKYVFKFQYCKTGGCI